MKTLKEIGAITAQNDYKVNFWNAMKFDASARVKVSNAIDSGEALIMPKESENDFRSAIRANGVIRNLATNKKKYSGNDSILAYESDDYASFVAEGETIPRFDVKDDFTKLRINSFKLASLAKLSSEFAFDAVFDVEEYVLKRVAKSFAKTEDKAFINGNGTTEPTGLLHDTAGADTGVTTSSITYDDCIDLFFSLKPEYRKAAVWIMNDNTALTLRKLKDSDEAYLWNQANDTILGRPVYICNEMPDAASGNKPVLFGDLSYYWIIDRAPVSFKPITELFSANNQVGYLGIERLDAKLVRSEAVKVIALAGE